MEYTVLKGKEVTTARIKLHTNLHNMRSSPNITRIIKSMCRRWGIESQEGQEIHTEFHLKKQREHLADLDTIYCQVYQGSRNRQCNSVSECAGHQERIYTRHQSLQKKHTGHYPHLQLNHPPHVKRSCTESTPALRPRAKSNKTALTKLIF